MNGKVYIVYENGLKVDITDSYNQTVDHWSSSEDELCDTVVNVTGAARIVFED